jgi:hypothetical protein
MRCQGWVWQGKARQGKWALTSRATESLCLARRNGRWRHSQMGMALVPPVLVQRRCQRVDGTRHTCSKQEDADVVYTRCILKLECTVGFIDLLQVRLAVPRHVRLHLASPNGQSTSATHTRRPATRQPNILGSGSSQVCTTKSEGCVRI